MKLRIKSNYFISESWRPLFYRILEEPMVFLVVMENISDIERLWRTKFARRLPYSMRSSPKASPGPAKTKVVSIITSPTSYTSTKPKIPCLNPTYAKAIRTQHPQSM
jgi:hypothetical protein